MKWEDIKDKYGRGLLIGEGEFKEGNQSYVGNNNCVDVLRHYS
jgi:hypothetical protein